MKYKIAHVFGVLDRGGAETLIMNILRNIDRDKFEFTFVAYAKGSPASYEEEIINYGCRIHYLPQLSFSNPFKFIKNWFDFFKKSDTNIIHFHIVSTSIIPILISKFFNKTTIVHAHSTNYSDNSKKYVKKFLIPPLKHCADYYCACGLEAGRWLFGKKKIVKNNFSIIANGIDTNIFKYDASLRKEYRKKIQLQGKLVLGHVGSFTTVKNHTFLVDLFNNVYQQNNNAVLLLVGQGPLEEEIKKKVYSLGLTKVVHFLGVRSDIVALMNAMDILVFPSLHEGLPVTLVEAQATGLSCLVSNTVSKEAKITGLCKFIPLNDINQWTEACLAEQTERGDTSAEIDKAGYSISSSVEKLQNIYCKLIDNKY